ncbi:MAG: hypothetical protein ABIW84_10840 [Ilumatobacteraceae bacterium]
MAIFEDMELIDLIPNSMSFRMVTTLDVDDEREIPAGFTGRVRRHDCGSVVYVAWYSRGRLHNPGKLHPAYRRFRRDGRIKYDLFYRDGQLDDPTDVVPAVRGYYASGAVHYEEHYSAGIRTDSRNGSAAVTKWREDGSLRHALNYDAGRRREST